MAPSDDGRAISSWRFLSGVLLHLTVPAYLIATPIIAFALSPAGAPLEALIDRLPVSSLWFLVGYVALSCVSITTALFAEPILRRRAIKHVQRNPSAAATASERRVAKAIATGMTFDMASTQILDALRGPVWDHSDPRFQALSVDLAEVVRTSGAAINTASAERRPALEKLTTTSLRRISDAHAALRAEQGRLDEGDAHTMARYIETRYGRDDFSGEEP